MSYQSYFGTKRHLEPQLRFMGVDIIFDEESKLNIPKPKKLPPYRTVGVRFIHGHNLAKVYTYRVRKAAKVHLGQEVIVESNPPTGWTKSLAVIVRIDSTPQDNGPFNYLFIEQAAKAL